MDLVDNSVSCRPSLAKYYLFCLFPAEVVPKLKFPNNSNARQFGYCKIAQEIGIAISNANLISPDF